MKKISTLCLLIIVLPSFSQVATTSILNINTSVMDNTPLLFGITFDARTSMTGSASYGQIGYYNANATMIPAVDAIFNDFPMSTLRYPANAVSVGFDWKKSVGPTASRPNQNASMMGALGGAQPMMFGFDEFMAMAASKGVLPSDVQIMVQIYDNTASGLTPTQTSMAIPNMVATAADWVEYSNAPNDGSNPGGGTDWAAQRASNGHPLPYGIKIWNIGNEPWASGEYGATSTGCNNYLTSVTPLINSMLAIDPTLKITLPTTGNATNSTTWAYTILNSTLVAQNKIYGISQHYFLSENVVSGNIPVGVVAAQNGLTVLINAATSKGVKVLIGDYAHSIQLPTTHNDANENIAMQWQGANLEADFLLMVSQKSNVDRVNFWAYGLPYGVWHPIRINSIGNYTLMPAADIYKKLSPAFLNKSVAVTTSSPAASDGNIYSVRSGAFVSNDLSLLNFVAVNRDKLNTVDYNPSGLAGYVINQARLLTAASLNAESFVETIVVADGSGNYSMPPLSILIVEYLNPSLSINEYAAQNNKTILYPNPVNNQLNFSKTIEDFSVYNIRGQMVLPKTKSANSIPTLAMPDGEYYIKSKNTVLKFMVKH